MGRRPGSISSSARRRAVFCTRWQRRRAIPSCRSPRIEPLALLEGAEQAYHDYDLRAFENPAWMYAGARHALELRARRTEFLGVFEPALLPFARWLAGNTARRSCRGGYGVLPVPAELPGSLDAMDAMLAGSRSAFETFLRVPLPARKRRIGL